MLDDTITHVEALADGFYVVVGAALIAAQQPLLHDLLWAVKEEHELGLQPRLRDHTGMSMTVLL